jgi:hypothetical protein
LMKTETELAGRMCQEHRLRYFGTLRTMLLPKPKYGD